MKISYKQNMPIVRIIVKGPKGEEEYDAYLDTGASKCLIPEKDAKEIGLPYAGDIEVITGIGKDYIRLYNATVIFLDKEFTALVFTRDLPEQAVVKAIVGREHLTLWVNYEKNISNTLKNIFLTTWKKWV